MKKIVFPAALFVSFLCIFPASSEPEEVDYFLPLKYGDSRIVFQGNNGNSSHNDDWNRYAFDFTMRVGTPVVAAASGVVTYVKDDTAGPTGKQEDNNAVAIRHADGNVSAYLHIRKDGAVVKKGQKVLRGDLIAYSGNTGYSRGPHLHFGLRSGCYETGLSTPCKFADVEGDGVPRTGDRVTSKNFSLRDSKEYKQVEKAAALYVLCTDLGCVEAAEKELKELGKIKAMEQPRALKEVYTKRDDILAEYENAAEITVEAITKADAGNDMKTAVRLAYLGEKDFALSKKAAEIKKLHSQLKKKYGYKEASAALKDELGYRTRVSRAIKSEIKADAKKKKGSKASYKSVIRNFEKALAVAPEGAVSEKLKKHIEEVKARN